MEDRHIGIVRPPSELRRLYVPFEEAMGELASKHGLVFTYGQWDDMGPEEPDE